MAGYMDVAHRGLPHKRVHHSRRTVLALHRVQISLPLVVSAAVMAPSLIVGPGREGMVWPASRLDECMPRRLRLARRQRMVTMLL